MKISVFFSHARTASEQEKLPLENILQKVRRMGYHGLEESIDFLLPRSGELLPPVKDAGLEFSSLYTMQHFEQGFDETAILKMLDAMPRFSCRKLMVVPGYFTQEHLQEVEWARVIDAMSFTCEAAEERGVTVSVENFGNAASPCFNLDRLMYLTEQVPSLKYTFDTGNFYFAQENALDAFHQLSSRLVHVHLKDYNKTPRVPEEAENHDRGNGIEAYPAPIGGGILPIRDYMQAILATGYNDYLCVEQFACANQLKDMEASIQFVRSLL